MQRFLIAALYAALISLGPVMLIYHRSLDTFWQQQSWQNKLFFVVYTLFAAIAVTKRSSIAVISPDKLLNKGGYSWRGCFQVLQKHEFAIFIGLFFFFYVACCALCQKLDFTQLAEQTANREMWKTFGLLIILSAMTIQMGLLRLTRIVHPIYFSCLLLLTGVPLLFSVWMPLFAVPGAFIIFKWHVKMQNRKVDFSEEAVEDLTTPTGTGNEDWQILPYIF
jgi:hypothetical protein